MRLSICTLLAAALILLGAGSGCQVRRVILPAETGAKLFPGFSGYGRKVTTNSPEAQRWFDQGIQLLYGFNHDEAIRSFQEAAKADGRCAMAWWGIAYASGFHINNPVMTEQQSRQAFLASREALRVMVSM